MWAENTTCQEVAFVCSWSWKQKLRGDWRAEALLNTSSAADGWELAVQTPAAWRMELEIDTWMFLVHVLRK